MPFKPSALPAQAVNRQPSVYFRGTPIPKAVQNILNVRGSGIWPPRPVELRKSSTVSVDIGADVRSLLSGDADSAARAGIPQLVNTKLRSNSPPAQPGALLFAPHIALSSQPQTHPRTATPRRPLTHPASAVCSLLV